MTGLPATVSYRSKPDGTCLSNRLSKDGSTGNAHGLFYRWWDALYQHSARKRWYLSPLINIILVTKRNHHEQKMNWFRLNFKRSSQLANLKAFTRYNRIFKKFPDNSYFENNHPYKKEVEKSNCSVCRQLLFYSRSYSFLQGLKLWDRNYSLHCYHDKLYYNMTNNV